MEYLWGGDGVEKWGGEGSLEVEIDVGDGIGEDVDGLGEFHVEGIVFCLAVEGDDVGFDSRIFFSVPAFLFDVHGGKKNINRWKGIFIFLNLQTRT